MQQTTANIFARAASLEFVHIGYERENVGYLLPPQIRGFGIRGNRTSSNVPSNVQSLHLNDYQSVVDKKCKFVHLNQYKK